MGFQATFCAHIHVGWTGPGEPPEDGEIYDMPSDSPTLTSVDPEVTALTGLKSIILWTLFFNIFLQNYQIRGAGVFFLNEMSMYLVAMYWHLTLEVIS